MGQETLFAKQEERFASLNHLLTALSELQGLHQQGLLEKIKQRQEKSLEALQSHPLKAPSAEDWNAYLTDLYQRYLLLWDTLRQRGDNLLAHEQAGFPVTLKFQYRIVLDGRTLAEPVNYSLLQILPEPGQHTDSSLPALIIVDPRGGHGAGIGGFKEDSTLGESLRAGHPTYFIAFSHAPEPEQTLEAVGKAQIQFVEWVSNQHPEGGKPVIIGNCQAGWAVMGLAALRPELPGLIIINGAPLSYWAGINGRNPMRYSGGLLGGSWLTRLGSDMGNGHFDGAWLASNFELLDPAGNWWAKYYRLFSQIDTEAPRFLEFERWWGSPILFNREEIESIVDELFIGNQLITTTHCKCVPIDLRNIEAPVVVFCSDGDNITPPQQALNWIAELYPTDLALHAAGRVIIYLKHNTIGHLGIFVSSQVARREHRQMIGAIDAIKALPAGLYELIIDDIPGSHPKDVYNLHFEPRKIADVLAQDTDGQQDEEAFGLVDRLSELNSNLYDWSVRPWLQQLINEPVADLLRKHHPFRQERQLWSSLNPALWWLPDAAQQAREQRQAISMDNPLLAWQNFLAKNLEDSLDLWRDWHDAGQEMLFHSLYGSLGLLTGLNLGQDTKPTNTQQHDQRFMEQLRVALPRGGKIEASMRILLLLAQAAGRLDKEMLQRLLADYREDIRNNPQTLSATKLREIAHVQNLLVFAYPQESLQTLPQLLPELADRQQVMEAVVRIIEPQWQSSEGTLGERWEALYQHFELPRPTFLQPAPASLVVVTEPEVEVESPAAAITATETAPEPEVPELPVSTTVELSPVEEAEPATVVPAVVAISIAPESSQADLSAVSATPRRTTATSKPRHPAKSRRTQAAKHAKPAANNSSTPAEADTQVASELPSSDPEQTPK